MRKLVQKLVKSVYILIFVVDLNLMDRPLFYITSSNFMNIFRFKLKSNCIDKYFEEINKTNFEGMTQKISLKLGLMITVFLHLEK